MYKHTVYFFFLPRKRTSLGILRRSLITPPPNTKIKRVEERHRVINLQSSWGSRAARWRGGAGVGRRIPGARRAAAPIPHPPGRLFVGRVGEGGW